MASHELIESYLGYLSRRLPAGAVEELSDGLAETYRHYLSLGTDPAVAARSAVADFGDPVIVVSAFTRQAPGRRAALMMLATGPVVGVCWGATLVAGHAWTWPVAAGMRYVFGLTLLSVVALLVVAGTSRASYARTRIAAVGGSGLVVLDLAVLVTVFVAAPALTWPMAAAVLASLARVMLTLRVLPAVVHG
jgi:hypothetical protein